jgi:pimeloyl-ACP methyl ester carboxylesterase
MLNTIRWGSGRPLLLVHGLGGSWRSWNTILLALAEKREVIAVDLPGHGGTPADADSGSFAGLARSLDAFIADHGLVGADIVGSSMGARLVLELARRGSVGAVVALDPGGFWRGWERTLFQIDHRRLDPPRPRSCARAAGAQPQRCGAHHAARAAFGAPLGIASRGGSHRTEEFCRHADIRCLCSRPRRRPGAKWASGSNIRPGHHRMGAGRTGSAFPAKRQGPRPPSHQPPSLVRQMRPLPDVGPA